MNAPVHALTSRLSDEDVERLHDLLERRAVPHDGMSLEMLDGFLSALVVGPELVMPSEYFPCIWNHEVVWDSEEEAGEAHRLINKLWNDIVYRVNLDLPDDDDDSEEAIDRMEEAMPLLAMPETEADEDDEDPLAGIDPDFPAAVAWAFGFMQGVSLRAEAWTRWENDDDHIAADLHTIAELTVLDAEHAEQMGMEREDVPDFAVRMSIAGSLPVILQNFNMYRMEQLGTRPVQREDLPGRNDLCPCGSGRKFKKCCGDPARLN